MGRAEITAGVANDDPPLGKCAVHDVDSCDACDRCGRYFCDACGGAPPNELYCAECDAKVGVIPWERDRARLGSLGAWWATVVQVVLRPAAALARVARTDAGSSFGFGIVSAIFLLVGSLEWMAVILYLQRAWAEERFGTGVFVGSLALMQASRTFGVMPFRIAATLATTPLVVRALARAAGRQVTLAVAERWTHYAIGAFALSVVPLGTLVGVVLAIRNIAIAAGGQHASMSTRGLLAMALLAWWIAVGWIVTAIYDATIGDLIREVWLDLVL